MPPIALNRRRFLGCSAAAGIALTQGKLADGAEELSNVRVGIVGLGGRGTTLLRTLLEIPRVEILCVADPEPKHCARARGIVEKAKRSVPESSADHRAILDRRDVDAVVVAVPCDLHASIGRDILRADKHFYGEKPLAITLSECDALIAETGRHPRLVAHIGHQRRSNPRYREGAELARHGDLGDLILGRAIWSSSNGPVSGFGGWLGSRARSGDWMVEQAVHIWDILHWAANGLPETAIGTGRRDLFRSVLPTRNVTDHYQATLNWPSGFSATMVHSWIDPADDAFTGASLKIVGTEGGFDFTTGTATYRDRSRPRTTNHPGNLPETRLSLQAFVDAIRHEGPVAPPISLIEARDAVVTGLLVRRAVDERREVHRSEIERDRSV